MIKQFIIYDKNKKIDINLSCDNYRKYLEKYKKDLESEEEYFYKYMDSFFENRNSQFYIKKFVCYYILNKLNAQPENFNALSDRLNNWIKIQIKNQYLTLKKSNKMQLIIRTKDIKNMEKNK